MENCKLIIVPFIAALVAFCSGVPIDLRITDRYNINQCDVTISGFSLLETNIYEPAKILPVKRTITYPESGLNTHKITCLKVINMDTSNHGGYPVIVFGGVGSTEVQILLTSQWGRSLNYRIEIWAENGAICRQSTEIK